MRTLSALWDFDHGISAIDTDYVRPLLDASQDRKSTRLNSSH